MTSFHVICGLSLPQSKILATLMNWRSPEKNLEGFISPEIFIYFFINSDSNITQTQTLSLKLFPNRTLTQTLT